MKHILLPIGKPEISKTICKVPSWNLHFGFALLVFAFVPFGANAQTTLNVTGGIGTISGDIYAYSIGEMVLVSTVETSSLVVTQGLLQSNVDELEIQENNYLAQGMGIYPNPVSNILFLQPSLQAGGELSLQLFDLRGRLIMQRKTTLSFGTEKQQLDLSALQEGTYLLQASLEQDGKVYEHSFKIIKFTDQ